LESLAKDLEKKREAAKEEIKLLEAEIEELKTHALPRHNTFESSSQN